MVTDFHKKFGLEPTKQPSFPVEELWVLKNAHMQEELDDLTVGKRFKGLNRETKKIDELRKQQNIAELPAGDDEAIDDMSDDSDEE